MSRAQSRLVFVFALVSLLGATRLSAQDPPPQEQEQPQQPEITQPTDNSQKQQQPKPAGRVYSPSDTEDASQQSNLSPDVLPLTGVQIPSIGNQETRHSYWVPGFQYGNLVRSSTLIAPNVTDWNTTSFIAGNLSLLEQWSRSELAVNYTGGGTISTDKSEGNGQFHQLDVEQVFDFRTVQLALIDQFSYLPQAQFGFAAASPLATPGIGGPLGPALPELQNNYLPSQSIFNSIGPRYSNGATVQGTYHPTRRSSITLVGSYGVLRFVDPGNIDTNDMIFSAGYDYQLDGRDTIGVLYRYTGFRYLNDPQAINDHVVQLAFGRKITGRTVIQLFVGPEFAQFRLTLGAPTTSVAAGANLTYTLSRTTFTANYNHGVSGGSGIFTGSETDQLSGAVRRSLSRVWKGNVSFGYARNQSLALVGTGQRAPTVNNWYVGGGFDRPFGHTATASIGYTAYLQELGSTVPCGPVGACGSYVQHQVSLSVQWHTRPFVLR
jgi:hypothetical protein